MVAAFREKARAVRVLYLILLLLTGGVLVYALIDGAYFNALVCLLTFGMLAMPYIAERVIGQRFSPLFECLVLLFIFAAEILGEVYCFYQRLPSWDTLLHGTSGFLLAAFGAWIMVALTQRDKSHRCLPAAILLLFSISFSMTVGVLWEFYEFGCDTILHTDMQKDSYIGEIYTVLLDEDQSNTAIPIRGMERIRIICADEAGGAREIVLDGYIDIGLIDTMEDLAVNFVGALVFGILCVQRGGVPTSLAADRKQ